MLQWGSAFPQYRHTSCIFCVWQYYPRESRTQNDYKNYELLTHNHNWIWQVIYDIAIATLSHSFSKYNVRICLFCLRIHLTRKLQVDFILRVYAKYDLPNSPPAKLCRLWRSRNVWFQHDFDNKKLQLKLHWVNWFIDYLVGGWAIEIITI